MVALERPQLRMGLPDSRQLQTDTPAVFDTGGAVHYAHPRHNPHYFAPVNNAHVWPESARQQ